MSESEYYSSQGVRKTCGRSKSSTMTKRNFSRITNINLNSETTPTLEIVFVQDQAQTRRQLQLLIKIDGYWWDIVPRGSKFTAMRIDDGFVLRGRYNTRHAVLKKILSMQKGSQLKLEEYNVQTLLVFS